MKSVPPGTVVVVAELTPPLGPSGLVVGLAGPLKERRRLLSKLKFQAEEATMYSLLLTGPEPVPKPYTPKLAAELGWSVEPAVTAIPERKAVVPMVPKLLEVQKTPSRSWELSADAAEAILVNT